MYSVRVSCLSPRDVSFCRHVELPSFRKHWLPCGSLLDMTMGLTQFKTSFIRVRISWSFLTKDARISRKEQRFLRQFSQMEQHVVWDVWIVMLVLVCTEFPREWGNQSDRLNPGNSDECAWCSSYGPVLHERWCHYRWCQSLEWNSWLDTRSCHWCHTVQSLGEPMNGMK